MIIIIHSLSILNAIWNLFSGKVLLLLLLLLPFLFDSFSFEFFDSFRCRFTLLVSLYESFHQKTHHGYNYACARISCEICKQNFAFSWSSLCRCWCLFCQHFWLYMKSIWDEESNITVEFWLGKYKPWYIRSDLFISCSIFLYPSSSPSNITTLYYHTIIASHYH